MLAPTASVPVMESELKVTDGLAQLKSERQHKPKNLKAISCHKLGCIDKKPKTSVNLVILTFENNYITIF